MVFTNLFNWVRAVRVLAIALVFAVVLFTNSSPALAFGTKTPAEPSEGTAQLDDIYQQAKQVTEGQPRGMEETKGKASQGLNSVQGAANAEKMKSSGDTGATTVKDDIKNALESATVK